MPPATAASTLPSRTSCAAETIACAPEPHTRFTVIAGTDTGSPERTAAWRPGFILAPAWTTLPMTAVPISSGCKPARSTALRITRAPRSVAGTSLRLPPKVPIAVRTGLEKTTDRCDVMGSSLSSVGWQMRIYAHMGAYALISSSRNLTDVGRPRPPDRDRLGCEQSMRRIYMPDAIDDLFRRFGKAFNKADVEEIAACVTDDVEWRLAAGAQPAGRLLKGNDELPAYVADK